MKLTLLIAVLTCFFAVSETQAADCNMEKVRDAFKCLQNEITDLRDLQETQQKTIRAVEQSNTQFSKQNESLQGEITSLKSQINQLRERLNKGTKLSASSIVNTLRNLPTPQVQATATAKSLQFDLAKCRIQNTKVVCAVSVTNTDGDSTIIISGSTEGYNEFGVKSLISSIKTAGRSFEMGPRNHMKYSLVKNVPLKMSFHFSDINSASTQFTALNIFGNKGDTRSNYKAELRGIVLL